jgi:ankyrin repeat protein
VNGPLEQKPNPECNDMTCALLQAVTTGNIKTIQTLLEDENTEISNQSDEFRVNSLHVAALRKNTEVVKMLLQKVTVLPLSPSPLFTSKPNNKKDHRGSLEGLGRATPDEISV